MAAVLGKSGELALDWGKTGALLVVPAPNEKGAGAVVTVVVVAAPKAKGLGVGAAASAAPNAKGVVPAAATVVVGAPKANVCGIVGIPCFEAGAPNANGVPESNDADVVAAAACCGACAPNLNNVPLPADEETVMFPVPNEKPLFWAVVLLTDALVPNAKLLGCVAMPAEVPVGDCTAVDPNVGGDTIAVAFCTEALLPKANTFELDPVSDEELDICVACVVVGWEPGAEAPNLNSPDDNGPATLAAGAAGPAPFEPNLNGSVDDVVTVGKKPSDVVGLATCTLEPNWNAVDPGRLDSAALVTAAFVSLALSAGNAGDAATAPKVGTEAVEGDFRLPPRDGPEKTKPPAGCAGFAAAAGDAAKAEEAGRGSVDVCGNEKGVVDDKLPDTAADWDRAGKASAVVEVTAVLGDVNLAKPASSGLLAVESVAVASSAGGVLCATTVCDDVVAFGALVVVGRLK